MWRRGSGGTVSGPSGGDIVGTVVAQNLRSEGVSSAHWHHSHIPRRCDSSELADSPLRAEAIKLVRELNRAVATHFALAALLGGSGDGPHLRDELRKARRTAQETAAAAKATLLPSLLDSRWSEKERIELERLWHLLLCCLDSLESSMERSLLLIREFALADGLHILIHTGLDGPNHNHNSVRPNQSSSSSSHQEPSEIPLLVGKHSLEGVEASQLCKELFELRAQLQELKSTVETRSLCPPEFDDVGGGKMPRRNETMLSMNGAEGVGNAGTSSISCSIPSDDKESIESDGSQVDGITGAQRKFICWILAIMVTIFFLAMILGIFIALFYS